MKSKKKLFIIHPFLFAIFPILFLISYNIEQVSFSEALLPSAIVLGFTILVLLLSCFIIGDKQKAGIVVSIFLLLFFSYGHVFNIISDYWQISARVLLSIFVLLFIFCSYFAIRLRKNLNNFTKLLNIMALLLVIISFINIVSYELKTKRLFHYNNEIKKNIKVSLGEERKKELLPDIYYLIFDRYPSSRTLQEYFNFDNSEFTDYLTNKGFYVASKSIANYPKTFLSLASSLNMRYLTFLTDEMGKESNDRTPIYNMIQNHEIWRFLKSREYRFIHFGSWFGPFNRNKYADMNITLFSLDDFSEILYKTTMLCPIISKLGIYSPHRQHYKTILEKFKKLSEIQKIKEPTFVFAHMIFPHYPYVFGPKGEILSKKQMEETNLKMQFLNQVIFANKKIKQLIDQILLKSDPKPIIVLQSDEGPIKEFIEQVKIDRTQSTDEAFETLRLHARILNAYYLPGVDKHNLYPSISPVNSFRLIFNLYFDTKYELLKDECYIYEDSDHIYKFMNVTDIVKY